MPGSLAWAGAARIVGILFAMSPSSAACERVFSMLERLFSDLQDRALADSIEAACMLVYNKRYVG